MIIEEYQTDQSLFDQQSIYLTYSNRIQKATGISNKKNAQKEQIFSEEFYHILNDELNYNLYERKQQLLSSIDQVKDYQRRRNIINLKNNKEDYFGGGKVKKLDEIRKIIDFNEEAFMVQRAEKNEKILSFLEYKQSLQQKFPQLLDEWGFLYSYNKERILQLPAVFQYDKSSNLYKLQGQLCKQINEFEDKENFENEIEQLITYLSFHLKVVHDHYKHYTYNNLLFKDTKEHINFDKYIHAIIGIQEMQISPQQEYKGPLHKEGYSVEGIMYSFLYIPKQSDQISDSYIQFELNEQYQNNNVRVNNNVSSNTRKVKNEKSISLGQTLLQENMMIIFHNCNMHSVQFKNKTKTALKRTIITIQIVNHLDQPFTTNDYQFNFQPKEEINRIPILEKNKKTIQNAQRKQAPVSS